MQIDHVLIVRKAQLATDMMNFFIGDFEHTRRHGFHAKCRNLLPAQPVRRVCTDTWTVMPVFCPKGAPVVIRVKQNGITLPDVESCLREGVFQVCRFDQLSQSLI